MSASRQDNNRPRLDGDALQRQEQDRRALTLFSTRFPVGIKTAFAASESRTPEVYQRRYRAYASINHLSERLPVQPTSHGITTPHAQDWRQ